MLSQLYAAYTLPRYCRFSAFQARVQQSKAGVRMKSQTFVATLVWLLVHFTLNEGKSRELGFA